MNSHTSSSCLLVVIAIFVTTTAVSGGHIMSPPAKIAGHNSNSSIALKKVVGAGSRINDPNTIATVAPSQYNFSSAINNTLYDDSNHGNVSVEYGTLTRTAWYQTTFRVLTIFSCFLMMITSFVYRLSESPEHSRVVENFTLGVAFLHYIALFTETNRQPIITDFKSTGICKLIIIIHSHVWQFTTNKELYNILKFMDNISEFERNIPKRTTFQKCYWVFLIISTTISCADIFHQVDRLINLLNYLNILAFLRFYHSVIQTCIEHIIYNSILIELIPGLVNIIVYVYYFKFKEIPISSIHPELLTYYEKKIATRNLMFKVSVLMFTVDFLYILDITMEWNFNAIHILHLLKSAQGILISYIIFFRPFAPVIYNELLERLRRRKGNANEETLEESADPMYKVTTV